MNDTNFFVLIGRITRDAEIRYSNGGMAISQFSIAVNTTKKNGDSYEDEVNFFDSALFNKRAESLNQYLTKGQQVAITGVLKQDRWEQEGQKRSKVKLICNDIQLLGGKQNSQQNQAPSSGGVDDDSEIPF